MKFLLTATFLSTLFLSAGAHAYQIDVNAKAAYLYHPATDTVVYEKDSATLQEPASLVKLMTLYLLFEAVEEGRLTLESELPVSEKAWKKGGSKMFVEVGKTVKVADLMRGIAIQSGNDACIVVAEFLGGTEEGFVQAMNAKAQELGLNNTTFQNATGWPHPQQQSTAADLTLLGAQIFEKFPNYRHIFAETAFTYSDIRQPNRNGLLRANVGVDGLKTGHTEASGYHLLATGTDTATGNPDRLFALVMGTDGFAAREGESLKLLRYGFSQFEISNLFTQGQQVFEAPVWLGTKANVPLMLGADAQAFVKKNAPKPSEASITYLSPLTAPLQKGQQVGELELTHNGKTYTAPLLVAEDMPKLGWANAFFQKLFYRLGL